METIKLTSDEVNVVRQIRETHFYDLKSRQISPAKLTKAMSAFANADGGELYIGIEDDGTWNGCANEEDYNGHLQAFEQCFPYSRDFLYEFLEHPADGTLVLHALIAKTRDVMSASDGKVYVRRGAQSLPVTDLDSLKRAKGLVTHETAPLDYPEAEISNSEVILNFMLTVVPNAEPAVWLRKQQAIVGDRPTVAGTMLFHEEPQVHLPKSGVKLYRYNTTDETGSRENLAFTPRSIEGDAYSLIRDTVSATAHEVESTPTLDPSFGFAEFKYPQETLHEVITNAIIHRDYAINDDVHVRIFENRIEVESPGPLPGHITPGNILKERFARNPMIVRLLNKFPDPPNQDVGEGLNTAFLAMRKLDLQDPEVVSSENSVLVIIRHEKLADAEKRIEDYIAKHGSISNKEARALLRKPEADRTIRRIFERMREADIIEIVPGTTKGGTRYRLKSSGNAI